MARCQLCFELPKTYIHHCPKMLLQNASIFYFAVLRKTPRREPRLPSYWSTNGLNRSTSKRSTCRELIKQFVLPTSCKLRPPFAVGIWVRSITWFRKRRIRNLFTTTSTFWSSTKYKIVTAKLTSSPPWSAQTFRPTNILNQLAWSRIYSQGSANRVESVL